MPLIIIENGDRQEYRIHGSTIYYTKVGWGELNQIRTELREKDGFRVDTEAVEEEVLRKHVCGWEGVEDPGGKPVPFTFEALLHLPHRIVETVLLFITSSATQEQEEQADLSDSSIG